MDGVYCCLGMKDRMVTSSHLPVRRPEFSMEFVGWHFVMSESEKLGKAPVRDYRHNQ